MAAAAAVPGAVGVGAEAEPARGRDADLGAGRRWQRVPVGIAENMSVRADRKVGRADRPSEVVDRLPVRRPQWVAAGVDAREPGRMWARAGRVDVPAEVERLGAL